MQYQSILCPALVGAALVLALPQARAQDAPATAPRCNLGDALEGSCQALRREVTAVATAAMRPGGGAALLPSLCEDYLARAAALEEAARGVSFSLARAGGPQATASRSAGVPGVLPDDISAAARFCEGITAPTCAEIDPSAAASIATTMLGSASWAVLTERARASLHRCQPARPEPDTLRPTLALTLGAAIPTGSDFAGRVHGALPQLGAAIGWGTRGVRASVGAQVEYAPGTTLIGNDPLPTQTLTASLSLGATATIVRTRVVDLRAGGEATVGTLVRFVDASASPVLTADTQSAALFGLHAIADLRLRLSARMPSLLVAAAVGARGTNTDTAFLIAPAVQLRAGVAFDL